MTIRRANLQACGRIWFLSMLAIGCGEIRAVTTMPAGSADAAAGTAGSDAGTAASDAGSGEPDGDARKADVAPPAPDASPDTPAGADAMSPDTSVECAPTSHICGGVCVSRTDVAHCGSSCGPCFAPTGGAATCDGVTCGALCPAGTKLCMATACAPLATLCGGDCPIGMHLCNDFCVSNSDVRTCGFSCTACAIPTGGAATCDGVACSATCPVGQKLCAGACVPAASSCLGGCPTGMHDCNGTCQSDTDPANCGPGCTACLAPANGISLCSNNVCGVICSAGFHLCSGNCVANISVLSCGLSCDACPVPLGGISTCDGLVCGIEMPHPG